MVPSYMTMSVHVTTKEMVACFTFSVILLCSDFQTFYLIYLYLGILTTYWHLGFLWPGLLQWCWRFWWLVTPGCAPLWLAPVEWFQHFQVAAFPAPGCLDHPTSTEVPRELISCLAHLWSTSLYSAEKRKKQMLQL